MPPRLPRLGWGQAPSSARALRQAAHPRVASAPARALSGGGGGAEPPQPELEYWFSTLSTYTYVSTMRIAQQAARRGVRLLWRPFNVR